MDTISVDIVLVFHHSLYMILTIRPAKYDLFECELIQSCTLFIQLSNTSYISLFLLEFYNRNINLVNRFLVQYLFEINYKLVSNDWIFWVSSFDILTTFLILFNYFTFKLLLKTCTDIKDSNWRIWMKLTHFLETDQVNIKWNSVHDQLIEYLLDHKLVEGINCSTEIDMKQIRDELWKMQPVFFQMKKILFFTEMVEIICHLVNLCFEVQSFNL